MNIVKFCNEKIFLKNVIRFTLFFGLLVFINITFLQISEKQFRIITESNELMEVVERDALRDIIVDLREREDYEISHIDSSINIPYIDGSELDMYLSKKHSKNKNIYLLCYSGNRSAKVFNYLNDKGYKNLIYVKFGYEDFLQNTGAEFQPASGPCKCLNE